MKRPNRLPAKLIFIFGSGLLSLSAFLVSRVSVASAFPDSQILRGHTGAVSSIDVSHDGHLFATGSLDHTVRLWDTQTGKTTRILQGHKDEVYAVAFSPDDRSIASSGYDGQVLLWDVKTGKLRQAIKVPKWSTTVAFSHDNRQVAIGSQERNIIIYDAQSGSVLRTLESRGGINTVAFSPDGRYFAASSVAIRIWDLQTGQVTKTLQGHRDSVVAIVFSRDSKFLASASRDKTARLWGVETGASLKTLETLTPFTVSFAPEPIKRKMSVSSVAFSPDGKTLAVSTGRSIHLWDVSTGNQLRTLVGHTESVTGVAYLPDGKSLASSSLDGTVLIWSLTQ